MDADKSRAATRRVDDAVGDIGVIESGLPTKGVGASRRSNGLEQQGRVKSARSSVAADGESQSLSISINISTTARDHRTQLRTSRMIVPKLSDNLPLREGRAKVIHCEVSTGGSVGSRFSMTGNGHHTKTRRTILYPMRVDIPMGSITAILGSAESGKSTLLKFLAGCMDKNTVYEGAVNLPGSTSYLPEQVFLHRFYTARSYIRHYDRLISARHNSGQGCFSSNPNQSNDHGENTNNAEASPDVESRNNNGNRSRGVSSFISSSETENLLDSLRIDPDRRDTIVGDVFERGLNPAEQRRLELGLLVLGSPDVLFCDNPVAGLDSETSLDVMEFLKGYISNSSRRVIVTLNRPSLFVWSLIDNVILLSKGRVVYEGPRFDMESFFADHKCPTPNRFSPLEHYLAVVNNFRRPGAAVNWENAFKKFQKDADEDDGDSLADDFENTEVCFPSAIPDVVIPQFIRDNDGKGEALCIGFLCRRSGTFIELLRRYIINIFRNPGMLLLRLVMYTCLSLLLGSLFYNLEHDDSYQTVNSRAALLFYSSSFYIFMVVAALPFLAHDQDIRDREMLNGLYHPLTHHLAVSVASIPVVLILSLVITGILVGMVKLQNAVNFFLILMLALWCAESYAFLMALLVKNYIIGIVCLAGIFGISMPLEGFMLVPGKFPSWLRWTNFVPFHTYAWRSLMYNEFMGTPSGKDVLESYEILDTNISHDMLVLLFYSLVIHLVCVVKLLLGNTVIMTQKSKKS